MEKRPTFGPVLLAGPLGFMIGITLGSILRDDAMIRLEDKADKRVVAVQRTNAQLTDMLSGSYEVSGLIVDDEAGSFEFTSILPGTGTEFCTGNFVLENDVARGVGSIACTTETRIEV